MLIKFVFDREGKLFCIEVLIGEGIVYVRVFEVNVGRVKFYFFDIDVLENSFDDRMICDYFYNVEMDKRIK